MDQVVQVDSAGFTATGQYGTEWTSDSLPLFAENASGISVIQWVLEAVMAKFLIVIVGHAGSGKTTLLDQLGKLWLQGKAFKGKIVLRLDLSKTDHRRVNSVEQLACAPQSTFSESLPHKKLTEELQRNGGQNVVLIIDHLTRSTSNSGFLSQLLSRSVLPKCLIIVAVEYIHSEIVIANAPSYELFEMKGVRKDDVYETVLAKGRVLHLKSTDRIADYIRAYPELQDMCRDPGLVQQVLEVYLVNCQCPRTVTSLLKAIVDKIVAKASESGASSDEIQEHLKYICFLAFQSLKHKDFSPYEFSCICADLGIPGSRTKLGLGLMQIFVYKDRVSCKFRHKTLQAFLAALYLRHQPIFDQAYLTLEFVPKVIFDDNYRLILIYFCGTANTYLTQSSSLNVAKITLYPLLESVADRLSLEENPEPKKLLLLLNCLYEAQDSSLTRKFLSRRQHLLTIPLKKEESMFAEFILSMLAYCIAHSGINRWMIEAASEDRFLMDYFKMLITDQLSSDSKSSFEIRFVEGFHQQVSPIDLRKIFAAKSKGNVYSRILRELFHRLLQLYSPIKLKSDGSNMSYISLLACHCLQELVETQRVLTLEPISASHWLPMKSKASKNSSQQEQNPQTILHMQQNHDNQHTEFVVMLVPFPQGLKFIMPGTRQEIGIELCTNNSPDFLLTGIEDSLNLMSTRRFFEETHSGVSSGKMILPGLPLPKQTHSRALTIAPDVPEPPRASRHSIQTSVDENLATPVPDTVHSIHESTDRREGQAIIQNRQRDPIGVHGSLFNFNGSRSRYEQSEQQSQVHKQSTMKPGVVVHTSIPNIFTTDQQYPLPDESRLLRKGGNGEIFLGTFGCRELVVKKTSYRNREIEIHRQLQHQNIIPLLCLMMGERHPSQRRKLTCYHFLPLATGDLAKLAVDNEMNTLKQLKVKYGGNPKQFGLVQGNMKYVLTQVLKGLVYLHAQSIVHRDLKASNILLTFSCSCTNPLMCSCAKKCVVQLADFDSAIQLTRDGLLPASKSGPNQRTFTVVPVGTMGYRPPESSQFILANDASIITPLVTLRSDLWSFGVLMLKMLLGCYGPSSQREVSFSFFVSPCSQCNACDV